MLLCNASVAVAKKCNLKALHKHTIHKAYSLNMTRDKRKSDFSTVQLKFSNILYFRLNLGLVNKCSMYCRIC